MNILGQWKQVFNINQKATFLICKLFLEHGLFKAIISFFFYFQLPEGLLACSFIHHSLRRLGLQFTIQWWWGKYSILFFNSQKYKQLTLSDVIYKPLYCPILIRLICVYALDWTEWNLKGRVWAILGQNRWDEQDHFLITDAIDGEDQSKWSKLNVLWQQFLLSWSHSNKPY